MISPADTTASSARSAAPNAAALAGVRRNERLLFLGLTSPAALLILVLVFLPVFWLSSLSLFDRAGDLSSENYRRLAGDLYVDAFVTTIEISAIVTALCVVLGYPLSYWLSRRPARTANLLMIFVLLPFWTAVLVRTYAWLVLCSEMVSSTRLS